jgi:DNA-binding MarR family transcriptional regulator
MSDYGKQFAQTTTEHIKQHISSLLDNFSSTEQEQLLQLMTKLLRSLEAEK